MSQTLEWQWLGRVPYAEALALQRSIRAEVLAGKRTHTLLLLEHPTVITLGRRGTMSDVLLSEDDRRRHGIEVFQIDRGGEATFHGPGQLVGYPMVRLHDLHLGPRQFVLRLAEALRLALSELGVETRWDDDHPGLWSEQGKVVAVGLNVHHGVTTHGFAANVSTDLSSFSWIVPCGQPGARAASVLSVTGRAPALDIVAGAVAVKTAEAFGLSA